jgi:hypothetical protein
MTNNTFAERLDRAIDRSGRSSPPARQLLRCRLASPPWSWAKAAEWPNPMTLLKVGTEVALTAAPKSAIKNIFCKFIRYLFQARGLGDWISRAGREFIFQCAETMFRCAEIVI